MSKAALLEEKKILDALPVRSIVTGETWHDEVYQKTGDDLWHTIGSPHGWFTKDLIARGPFVVLRRGESGP